VTLRSSENPESLYDILVCPHSSVLILLYIYTSSSLHTVSSCKSFPASPSRLNLGASHVSSIFSIIFKSTVAYTLVARQWIYKQRPLLGNARNIYARNNRRTVFSVVCAAAVSAQQLGKHVPATVDTNATIEERCFMWPALRPFLGNGSVNTFPRQGTQAQQ
jgi:hypothetical protein